MLIDRLIQKLPCRSRFATTLTGSAVAALIVSVAVVAISEFLGFGMPAGVAAGLGAASGAAYAAVHR